MPGQTEQQDVYKLSERSILELTTKHYEHQKVITGYSSWAASLHLVLCYANSMDPASKPHVAVMDTQDLDGEVVVWQCTHVLSEGDEEYLAWGCVRGRGYKAVPLDVLENHGVLDIFPQLKDGSYRTGETFEFGDECRSAAFQASPVAVAPNLFEAAEKVASLFKPLFVPVFTALLCLESRPWGHRKNSHSRPPVECLSRIIDRAGAADVLNNIRLDYWLRPGKVDTTDFPDVEQWIDLLRALVQHQIQRDLKKAQPQVIRPPKTLDHDLIVAY